MRYRNFACIDLFKQQDNHVPVIVLGGTASKELTDYVQAKLQPAALHGLVNDRVHLH